MIIKATTDFTDKETREEITAGKEFYAPRKRGVELINKGFARLVSNDDVQQWGESSSSQFDKVLREKDSRIAELEKELSERDRQIEELTDLLPASKRAKFNG